MKTTSKSNGKTPKAAPKAVSKTPKAAPVGPQCGPVVMDGFLHFSQFDLTRFELAQAKVLNSQQAITLKRAEAEQARRQYEDAIRKMNEELGIIMLSSRSAESELRTLQKELQELYQLDFENLTYDDKTGRISILGSPIPEDDLKSATQ